MDIAQKGPAAVVDHRQGMGRPCDLRRDALQAAAQMAVEITRLVEQEGRLAVVTLGKWEVKPGAMNVIPDEMRFSIDLC